MKVKQKNEFLIQTNEPISGLQGPIFRAKKHDKGYHVITHVGEFIIPFSSAVVLSNEQQEAYRKDYKTYLKEKAKQEKV